MKKNLKFSLTITRKISTFQMNSFRCNEFLWWTKVNITIWPMLVAKTCWCGRNSSNAYNFIQFTEKACTLSSNVVQFSFVFAWCTMAAYQVPKFVEIFVIQQTEQSYWALHFRSYVDACLSIRSSFYNEIATVKLIKSVGIISLWLGLVCYDIVPCLNTEQLFQSVQNECQTWICDSIETLFEPQILTILVQNCCYRESTNLKLNKMIR